MGQPAATAPEEKVRAVVLRRLLRGEALDLASLAAAADFDPPAVAEALANLNASGAIYLADGTDALSGGGPGARNFRIDHSSGSASDGNHDES